MNSLNHPPEAVGLIMVDFDSTLHPWGTMFGYPEPIEGGPEFMSLLKGRGYTLGIFTSRLSNTWLKVMGHVAKQHTEYITNFCALNGIPFDFITAEKRPAEVYIDDKAITFNNNWKELTQKFTDEGWI